MESSAVPYDLPSFPPDRFVLQDLLGEGGTGQVFVARDTYLKREVALKLLRPGQEGEGHRLVLEARNLAAVRHPNVVPIHEVGLLDGLPCITMDLIEGRNLWETREELSLAERVDLVAQAARGAHAAHRAGLVHRDLKPQNILVEREQVGEWRAHVVDFGLAFSNGVIPETTLHEGTPLYMAPEQVRDGGVLDARSDVFSLGAVLYAMVVGRPPFEGISEAGALEMPKPATLAISEPILIEFAGAQTSKGAWTEVFRRLLDEDPIRPRAVDRTIPQDLETIILRALEKEPHRRYPTALALAEDLDRYLAGEPIQARPHSTGYRLRRYFRRNPAVAWATGVALALALTSVGVIAFLTQRAQRRILTAQRYGALAQEIEQRIRLNHMLPLHDRRPHLAWAQARIQEIRQAAEQDGPLAQGPLAFLEGITHLRLNRAELAKAELEKAWRLGFHSVAAAEALFEANLDVELSRTVNRNEAKSPEQARGDARELALLAQAMTESRRSEPSLLEARKAFLEGNMDEALRMCDAVLKQKPWAYEAHLLAGGIDMRLASATTDFGTFRKLMAEANQRFDRAIALAPSDPKPYLNKVASMNLHAVREANVTGGKVEWAPLLAALEVCDRAETADPSFARVFARRSQILLLLASWGPGQSDRGRKWMFIREAISNARKGQALDAQDSGCAEALGWVLQAEVDLAFEERSPQVVDLARSTEAELWKLIKFHPNQPYLRLAMTGNLAIQQALEQEAGLDPRPTSQRGLQVAREAWNITSRNAEALGLAENSLTDLLLRILMHGDLELAFGDGGAAGKGADEALQILNTMPAARLGGWPDRVRLWATLQKAEAQILLEQDSREVLASAKALESRIKVGDFTAVHGRLPRVAPYDRLLLEAEVARRRGHDPRPLLQTCYQEASRAIREDRPEAYGTMYALLACLAESRFALEHGLNGELTAARGLKLAKRFALLERRTWPDEPKTYLPELGEIFFALGAKGSLATPRDYERASVRLEALLSRNPHLAHRYRTERAMVQPRGAQPKEAKP